MSDRSQACLNFLKSLQRKRIFQEHVRYIYTCIDFYSIYFYNIYIYIFTYTDREA